HLIWSGDDNIGAVLGLGAVVQDVLEIGKDVIVNFYDVAALLALLKIVDEVVAEAGPKHESIVAIATNQHIVARASLQPVAVSPSVYNVIGTQSIDCVFALAADNMVLLVGRELTADARGCIDRVGPGGAGDCGAANIRDVDSERLVGRGVGGI